MLVVIVVALGYLAKTLAIFDTSSGKEDGTTMQTFLTISRHNSIEKGTEAIINNKENDHLNIYNSFLRIILN
jgi:hypothetical protein